MNARVELTACRCKKPLAPTCRREFLERLGAGFGMFGLVDLLLRDQAHAARVPALNPLAPKPPHVPAKAKSVIYLFMHGGPSHIDSFDPKPALQKLHGQKLPESLASLQLQFTKASDAPILAPRVSFRKYGQSGIEISENWPHLSKHADDLAVIRSCYHDGFTHSLAMNLVLTGSIRLGFPSVGSWISYGLGSESENLPGYIVMLSGGTKAGPPAWSSGFLPASYSGTLMRTEGAPFLNTNPRSGLDASTQRMLLDDLSWFNARHQEGREDDSALSSRIAAYELAFRMQTESPDLADLAREPEKIQEMYGLKDPATRDFGMKCLMARRLVERGVRFIQLYSGTSDRGKEDWDGHDRCDANQRVMSRSVDQPITALLADLKRRGLLDQTLVIWGGDFGRTPTSDGNKKTGAASYEGGRDHNPYGYTMWLAGGGVRGGKVIGSTDEIGFVAVEDRLHVHDINATILALLGLDHRRLTFPYQGRQFRLTDVHGENEISSRLLR